MGPNGNRQPAFRSGLGSHIKAVGDLMACFGPTFWCVAAPSDFIAVLPGHAVCYLHVHTSRIHANSIRYLENIQYLMC